MTRSTKLAIHWFRQDLRVIDNPGLSYASDSATVLPIYILDTDSALEHAPGAASRVWLHEALSSLNNSLNNHLSVYEGDALTVLLKLVEHYEVHTITWNRCYEPWRIHRDKKIKETLKQKGIHVKSFNASLLWEPWEIKQPDGTPYEVFTRYYRKGCLKSSPPRKPLAYPEQLQCFSDSQALNLEQLGLKASHSWTDKLLKHWSFGEQSAIQQLESFIERSLSQYKEGRNHPFEQHVSKLSPYLQTGEISPHQVWDYITALPSDKHTDHFCSELGWREFSYYLLYYHPDLPTKNLQAKFNDYPWIYDASLFQAWKRGMTGIPMVDAGMRELWETGYMHNRSRMIVGSFLTKNLHIHWNYGERWFWDCLFDADLANNSAGWQWVAGSGADAATYFRIFNPVTQGEKFDPKGEYIRHYVPELAKLPNDYLYAPWEAPPEILEQAGVILGKTYPQPIVDLGLTREQAVSAFDKLS